LPCGISLAVVFLQFIGLTVVFRDLEAAECPLLFRFLSGVFFLHLRYYM
jgi:hypothetical protein